MMREDCRRMGSQRRWRWKEGFSSASLGLAEAVEEEKEEEEEGSSSASLGLDGAVQEEREEEEEEEDEGPEACQVL